MTLPPLAPSHPLHLLRALLRQCTYLPDPAARRFFPQEILSRYRKYAVTGPTAAAPFPPHRIHSAIVTARRCHSLLLRANQGAIKPLLKVLSLTYGRTGRRRHELLNPLLAPDRLTNASAVEHLAAQAKIPLKQRVDLAHYPAVSSKLATLTRSQKRQYFPRNMAPDLKGADMSIPEKNAWGRPLPKCRERNLRRKKHGVMLARTLPPLPEAEWMRLQALVSGTTQWAPVKKRRRPAEVEAPTFLTPDVLQGRLERHPSAETRADKKHDQPHHITPRFMRRAWGRIFLQCPVMRRVSHDTTDAAWSVEWARPSREERPTPTMITDPDAADLMFGKGLLDENGKRIQPKAPRRAKDAKADSSTKGTAHAAL